MPKVLVDAIASSSAHGISKAAGSRTTPLRVMWIVLFVFFLAMFFKDGFILAIKFRDNRLTKEYHMNSVPFAFPDLYFCPSNSYSGSYPFLLKAHEAQTINDEISRILIKQKQTFGTEYNAVELTRFAQASLPFHLITRYLVQRKEQAVLYSAMTSKFDAETVNVETFYHPENLVCFKLVQTAETRRSMESTDGVLEIWLTTDPYFSDFNFTGEPINRITDWRNRSVTFASWHQINIVENLKMSGFTMLIVPPGAYPSLKFEKKFHIASGNAYSVQLKMIKNTCSPDLHKTHCVTNHPEVAFTNPSTWQPEAFKYSSAACYHQRRSLKVVEQIGCQQSMQPLIWEYQAWPKCYNVSELTPTITHNMSNSDILYADYDAVEHCKNRIPCEFPEYSASFSFGRWPSVGSSTAEFFASRRLNATKMPGLAKLAQIAKLITGGNHSSHLEGIFNSYVSESMLSVRVSAASATSSQVVLTWSYTVTDFLADAGGLLGLYIGCSMLTLCELLELVYVLVEQVCKRRSTPRATPGEAEATGDPVPGEASSALEAEMKV